MKKSKITIGAAYFLDYPEQFTSLPDYTAHAGLPVKVLRELEDGKDYDYEGDRMFHVEAADGWTGDAWESELKVIST